MSRYIGQSCPHCHVRFLEGDDIVVCPDCGTPHHRTCYTEAGECANIALHSSAYDWKPVPPEPLPITCRNCNSTNPPGTDYCQSCNMPLVERLSVEGETPPEEKTGPLPQFLPSSLSELFSSMLNYSEKEQIDGITIKEWSIYIGNAAPNYIINFKRMNQTRKKISFSFAAFFFGPLYFFYRRMWLIGLIAMLIQAVLSIPTFMLMANYMFGISLAVSVEVLTVVNYVMSVLLFGVNMLFSMYAIHLFRGSAGRAINKLKKRAKNEREYFEILESKSGPCTPVIFAVIILFALTFLI